MGPQCEDGYTKIANELLEALCAVRIPGESMQIFLVILRKTYGFGKKEDAIPLSQIHAMTGIPKSHISRAAEKLSSMQIVTIIGNGSYTIYKINKHHELWEKLPKKVTEKKFPIKGKEIPFIGNDVPFIGKKSSLYRVPQKKKETSQKKLSKEKAPLLPVCEAWKGYLDMRKKIKKPMTERAETLAVMDLEKLFKQGHDPTEVLNQSTLRSWQGLFPIKGDGDGRSGNNGSAKTTGRKAGLVEANPVGTDWLGTGD